MFRYADSGDLTLINHLIRDSKGFWGYSDSFLDAFMERWGIKESYFHTNKVKLLEKEGEIIGLYAFKVSEQNTLELDLFFVAKNHIGQGIGKTLWDDVLHEVLDHGWTEFQIISDPNAEGFYELMGAKTINKFESFPGRFVPVMTMKLTDLIIKRSAKLNEVDLLKDG